MATVSSPSKKRYNVDAVRQHNQRHEINHNFYESMVRSNYRSMLIDFSDIFSDYSMQFRKSSYKLYCERKKFYRQLIGRMRQYDRVLPLP